MILNKKIPHWYCRYILLSLWLLIFSLESYAQYTLQGNLFIQDQKKEPVIFANTYLLNTQKGTQSNLKGGFEILDVKEGNYTLVISAVGFEDIHKKIHVPSDSNLGGIEMKKSISLLPEVQVITHKSGKQIKKTGSVQLIDKKEIEKFNYTDINNLLAAKPGVSIQQEDGFGLRPNIGLRGSGTQRSAKISILEDGIPVSPAPYTAPAAYYFPTIGRMQSVEISKGSSQIMYGPITTSGAINFISSSISETFNLNASLSAGSFQTQNLHVNLSEFKGRFGYLIDVFKYSSNGFKNLADQNTGFDKTDYLLKFGYRSKETDRFNHSIYIKALFGHEMSNETYLGLTQNDFSANPYNRYLASRNDQMKTNNKQFSIHHTLEFSKSVQLITTGYLHFFDRNWYKLNDITDQNQERIKIASIVNNPTIYQEHYKALGGYSSNFTYRLKANNRAYSSKGVQTQLVKKFSAKTIQHTARLSVRYHFDDVDRYQWTDDYQMLSDQMSVINYGTPGSESNKVAYSKAFSGYLVDEINIKKLMLNVGLRVENIFAHQSDYGKQDIERTESDLVIKENAVFALMPGIGFHYAVDSSSSIFGGIHKGFAPPGYNPDTRPESSLNYELGHAIQKNRFKSELVLFYNDYANLLGSDLAAVGGQGSDNLFNGGSAQTKGLEYQLSYLFTLDKKAKLTLPIQLSYTYTDAFFENSFESDFDGWGDVVSGDRLPYVPKHQISTQISINYMRFSAHMTSRFISSVIAENSSDRPLYIPDYFTTDLSLHFALKPQIKLWTSITNISDEVYNVSVHPAGYRPGMPRAFLVGVKARF